MATWYGLTFIFNQMGLSPVSSYVLGTITSAVSVPHLIHRSAKAFRGTAAMLAHYNPIESEPVISSKIVDWNWARQLINLTNILRSIYLALPVALVAGEGMAAGIGSGAPHIDLKDQWYTLAPNMVAWGMIEHYHTEQPLYNNLIAP